MIKIESDKQSFDILLPTNLGEITREHIDTLLENVHVSKYYCIVALVYKEKLFGLVSAMQKGNGSTEVIPMLAKLPENPESDFKGNILDRVYIDRSSLERGIHIRVKNNIIEPATVAGYIQEDPQLVKDITTGKYFNDGETSDHFAKMSSPYCYFLEFKIVPISDIVGYTPLITTGSISPFKSVKEDIN